MNQPILWIDTRKMVDSKMTAEEIIDVFDIMVAYTLAHAWVPGISEQVIIIMDVQNVSVWEYPFQEMSKPIQYGSKNWKMRLTQVYVINLPWYINKPIEFVKSLMPLYARVKLQTRAPGDHLDELD